MTIVVTARIAVEQEAVRAMEGVVGESLPASRGAPGRNLQL